MVETLSKELHDALSVFLSSNMGMTPSSMSASLKGWPELIHAIRSQPPEAITYDQLRELQGYNAMLADCASNMRLGLPGMTISDYVKQDIKAKTDACLARHPDNKAFQLMKAFYKEHLDSLLDAANAFDRLGHYGAGYSHPKECSDALRLFADTIESLDNNRSGEYSPDMTKCVDIIGKKDSPLRSQPLHEAMEVADELHRVLGKPSKPDVGDPDESFEEIAGKLSKAIAAWSSIRTVITSLKATRHQAP